MSDYVTVAVKNSSIGVVYGGLQKLEDIEALPYDMVFRAGLIMNALRTQGEASEKARQELFVKYGISETNKDGEEVSKLNKAGVEKLAELLDATGAPVLAFKASEFRECAEKNGGKLPGLTPALVADIAPVILADS